MTEEELKVKAEELERKEGDLTKKEEALNEKETQLASREADTAKIAQTLTEEYEKKLQAQKVEFEERLKAREDVIKQLASGEKPAEEENAFTEINKRRRAQKAA